MNSGVLRLCVTQPPAARLAKYSFGVEDVPAPKGYPSNTIASPSGVLCIGLRTSSAPGKHSYDGLCISSQVLPSCGLLFRLGVKTSPAFAGGETISYILLSGRPTGVAGSVWNTPSSPSTAALPAGLPLSLAFSATTRKTYVVSGASPLRLARAGFSTAEEPRSASGVSAAPANVSPFALYTASVKY